MRLLAFLLAVAMPDPLETIHQLVDAGHVRRVQIDAFEVLQSCSSTSLTQHVKKLGAMLQPFLGVSRGPETGRQIPTYPEPTPPLAPRAIPTYPEPG